VTSQRKAILNSKITVRGGMHAVKPKKSRKGEGKSRRKGTGQKKKQQEEVSK